MPAVLREGTEVVMPKKIHGKKLTAKEHRQWKHVYERTHDGAQATAVVMRTMAKRTRKK